MNLLGNIWHKLGSANISIVVLVLLIVDLIGGYMSLKGNEGIFSALNNLGLVEWTKTYGLTYPKYTAWLIGFMILVSVLALNTFVCTTNRVIALIKFRSAFTSRVRHVLKFSVHIMHYALIVILSGYLLSYLFAQTRPGFILVPGKSVPLPGSNVTAFLESVDIEFYRGKRLSFLKDRAYSISAIIELISNGEKVSKEIGLNRPFRYRGMSFHLRDFGPKYRKGMNVNRFVNLVIKRDLGVKLYFAGTCLFLVGLVMYLFQWFLLKAR